VSDKSLPHGRSITAEEERVFFFLLEAIDELILLRGIAGGKSISRTIAGELFDKRYWPMKISGLRRYSIIDCAGKRCFHR
jgi:hypothetical protein